MIVIIDYNMGNIGSIVNMIKKAGGESIVTSDVEIIKNAKKLILPGVGAFDSGMKNIEDMGLLDVLNEKVLVEKTPILGICLGMQLFCKCSEEGSKAGLSWIDGVCNRFDFSSVGTGLRIPHMGWNSVEVKKSSPLMNNLPEEPAFYFVHSYYVICNNADDVLTTTNYGYEFCSSVNHENIYATQFHPEKSHKYGLAVIKNFVEL
jgi:glutamine amidotransferase